ncbi:MAG: NAD(P)H-dependent oxidoreductase [Chitinophagaceae bacterium]
MNNIIEQLNWRYAVKKYDSKKKLSEDNIALLQEAIQLSPSSHGLQPYRVIFIEEKSIREKLLKVSYNQSQIVDASHLVVFAIETNVDEKYIDNYFENICQTRNIALEGNLMHHKHSVKAALNKMSVEAKMLWATNQTYIALGFLLFAAAQLGIDANPMEGFMPVAYNDILGLNENGMSAVVIACLGTRHHDDFFQHFKKVRKPFSELFVSV